MRNKSIPFDELYKLLSEFKDKKGHCLVPYNETTSDGIKLGGLVHSLRAGNRKVSNEERKMLDDLGFVWSVNHIYTFDEIFEMLTKYVSQNGHCNVPANCITEDGVKLGHIVQGIRKGERKLNEEEKRRLDNIKFVWAVKTPFSVVLDLLVDYEKKHGNCNVPIKHETKTGIKLGHILHNIKTGKRKVNAEEKLLLELIGVKF